MLTNKTEMITSKEELTNLENLFTGTNLYLPKMIKIIDAELRYNALHYGRASTSLPTYSKYIGQTLGFVVKQYPGVWVDELETHYGFLGIAVKWIHTNYVDIASVVISTGTIIEI